MYPDTPGARFDHAYYRARHMPPVRARLRDKCRDYTVDKGLDGIPNCTDEQLYRAFPRQSAVGPAAAGPFRHRRATS